MKTFKALSPEGLVRYEWTDEKGLDETHYDGAMGKPGTYRVVIEDVTAIASAKKDKDDRLLSRQSALRGMLGRNLSNAEIQNVIQALIKSHLGED